MAEALQEKTYIFTIHVHNTRGKNYGYHQRKPYQFKTLRFKAFDLWEATDKLDKHCHSMQFDDYVINYIFSE